MSELIDLDDLPLSPLQLRSIAEATARINLWHGSVRSGKTISSLIAFLMAVADPPRGGLICILGRTKDTIYRNVIVPLQDEAVFGPLAKLTVYTRGANHCIILGRTVEIIGANDAQSETKVRGGTWALVYVDEASVIPAATFRQALARLSVPGARMYATTNPEGPYHWLRQEYLLRANSLNMRTWRPFTLDDNPGLPADYVRDLKREYTGVWYRRMILGEWAIAEGAVYDMWDHDRHVIPAAKVPHIRRWLAAAVDYGTSNPFSALLLGLADDGGLYLVDEWRWDSAKERRQLTDGEYSRRYQAWLSKVPRPEELAGAGVQALGVMPERHYIDPSAASFKVQLHHDGVQPVSDAVNEVVDGIRIVSSQLASGRLLVSDRCRGWIDEIPGYVWDPKAQERGEDAPIKKNDHSLDAGRYATSSTEFLWMREPWQEVKAA